MISGVDEQSHLEVASRFGVVTAAAARPPFPERFYYVWVWYIELHRRRGFIVEAGISKKISWNDIHSWSSVRGLNLASHELDMILQIDDLHHQIGLEVLNKSK